ncbi:hypothetical protein [Sinomonas humi]|uniref:hypothetical protein n=1 Tax=Sinomonas humi TaxID=1338436 RepID=UPI0012E07DA7|nr:hypothetical protein [Sinomonas humi]
MHVETLVGSTREATDFLGVMVEKEGVVSYSTFGWVRRLNKAKGGRSCSWTSSTPRPPR